MGCPIQRVGPPWIRGLDFMRVLLVNPWIYDFAAYDLWSKPLGLIRLASHLKDLGVEVALVDCLDRFHPLMHPYPTRGTPYGDGHYHTQVVEKPSCFGDIPRKFKRYGMPLPVFHGILDGLENPDLILVGSGLTYWYRGVFLAIRLLKERFGSVPVLLGGIYATLCFEHAKKFSRADRVFKENTLRGLLKAVGEMTGRRFMDVQNDLSNGKLNVWAYSLYPKLEYVTLRTSNGCPFRCTYCGWHLMDSRLMQVKPKEVVETLAAFFGRRGVRNFAFYDDALLYNAQDHFVRIFKAVLEIGLQCNFHTPNGLHCRFITRDVAKLMKDAGFVRPRLGLERVDAPAQRRSGGKVNRRDFQNALECLKEAGYAPSEIQVNLLVGLPGQRFRDVERGIGFLENSRVRIRLEEYSPVPYTEDFDKSNLSLQDDPLLHNNTAFAARHPEFKGRLQLLKNRVRQINSSLR